MSVDTNLSQSHEVEPLVAKRSFWLALIGLVLVAGIGWIAISKTLVASGGSTAAALNPAPVAGHPAPDFELLDVDGQAVRLSDYRGTPVILNFWATWCAPCRAEFPEFQEAAVDNADRLVIIGVNNTAADQASRIPDFLQEFGITFPIVLDEQGEVIETYQVLGLPTTVFINSDGVINEIFTGPLNKAYIEAKIAELEAEL